MGRISGEVAAAGQTVDASARGFGDPMLEFDVNLIGPPAQKNLPDVLRYEPGFSLDLIADLALPVGEYDSDQPLNLGQNRWYGRVGAPDRLAARPVGAGPAHDPGAPARRVVLRDQRRLHGADPRDRPDVPGGRAPDARLHRAPLGLARRRLVHGRPSDHRRRRGARSSTTWRSGSRSATRSTTTWASPSATCRPSTTALPATSRWTASWSRSSRAGTRSSRVRDG